VPEQESQESEVRSQNAARWTFLALAVPLIAGLVSTWPHRHLVELPRGVVNLHAPIEVAAGTELRGAAAGTVLRAADDFRGRAVIAVRGSGVLLHNFGIDGNRAALERPAPLAPYDTPFAHFTENNGILAEAVSGLRIEDLRISNVAGFAILVSHAADVIIEGVMVRSSGGRNALRRNNSTGGILLEQGSTDFRVTGCVLREILGNGIWTHSLYGSPRNERGLFAGNRFDEIGRDAIQVGHAIDIRVEENEGKRIGYPAEAVDRENRAIPVAIDTAGNVERTLYTGNRFEENDGKCIDLDGFHDGAVSANTCYNAGPPRDYPFGNYGIVMNNSNPDMQSRNIQVLDNIIDGALYGGIFVIGAGHRIAGNRLLHLNTARCGCVYDASQPDILAAGIYLGKGAERPAPAASVVVEGNFVSGYRMKSHCVESAPSIPAAANTVRNNQCEDR
jgi:hypothetical protein